MYIDTKRHERQLRLIYLPELRKGCGGVWTLKGKENNSQESGKSKYLVHKYLVNLWIVTLGIDNGTQRGVNKRVLPSYPQLPTQPTLYSYAWCEFSF